MKTQQHSIVKQIQLAIMENCHETKSIRNWTDFLD